MATDTFRDFVELLDREGELARVKTKVSPVLEIAEVCDRVSKSPAPHGHAELDRNPGGKLGGGDRPRADSPGLERGRRRERAPSREDRRARGNDRYLRRDEPETAHHA